MVRHSCVSTGNNKHGTPLAAFQLHMCYCHCACLPALLAVIVVTIAGSCSRGVGSTGFAASDCAEAQGGAEAAAGGVRGGGGEPEEQGQGCRGAGHAGDCARQGQPPLPIPTPPPPPPLLPPACPAHLQLATAAVQLLLLQLQL